MKVSYIAHNYQCSRCSKFVSQSQDFFYCRNCGQLLCKKCGESGVCHECIQTFSQKDRVIIENQKNNRKMRYRLFWGNFLAIFLVPAIVNALPLDLEIKNGSLMVSVVLFFTLFCTACPMVSASRNQDKNLRLLFSIRPELSFEKVYSDINLEWDVIKQKYFQNNFISKSPYMNQLPQIMEQIQQKMITKYTGSPELVIIAMNRKANDIQNLINLGL